ncbi:hypothetical protein [Paracoccus tegillarcae]|nr:hypothetical protein [Paracoccus tegillarcae]
MRHIYQGGEDGCGAASVAMLADIELAEAREIIDGGWRNCGKAGLQKALEKKGISLEIFLSHKFVKLKRPEKLAAVRAAGCDLLLKVKGKDGNIGHWMVWDSKRGRLLDPYSKKAKEPCFDIDDADRAYKVTGGQ